MLTRISIAVGCLIVAATAAPARVFVTEYVRPTVGLPGATTILSLQSDNPDEIIYGVDARFEGPMNQVNPLGMATPFQDLNAFFGQADVSQDSQFLFNSNDLSPPPLGVAESDSLLKAAITSLPEATGGDGSSFPLAQIVMLNYKPVYYRLSLDIRDRGGNPIANRVISCRVICVPEPTTMGLMVIGLFAGIGVIRRRLFA